MAVVDTPNPPLPTRNTLLIDSIININGTAIQESLKRWSSKGIQQVKFYIETTIQPRWKDVQKEPQPVENCLNDAFVEPQKNFKDPKNLKGMPSFATAVFTLKRNDKVIHSFPNNPVVVRFIEVGIHLIELVKLLVELDLLLENFESFQSTRNKILSELKQIQALITKPANGEIHRSLNEIHSIQKNCALLLSVVPKSLDIIESIVKKICEGISDDVHLTEDEINNWLEQMKEEKNDPELIFHCSVEHYVWNTSAVAREVMQDEEVTALNELIEKQSQKIDDQEKEILKLKRLLEEQTKRCQMCETKEETSDDFSTLLRLSREKSGQTDTLTKYNTNFSTSNFAYGVFDSKGGKLSVENGDVKLLIPDGALSSPQEIYIYVDPKVRFFSSGESSQVDSSETRLAPIVHCGPPGTTFLSHVILTVPHNACDEGKWQFKPVRSDGEMNTQNWQAINISKEEDDSIVIVEGGLCVFMIKHFTCFTVLREQKN